MIPLVGFLFNNGLKSKGCQNQIMKEAEVSKKVYDVFQILLEQHFFQINPDTDIDISMHQYQSLN